MEKNKILLAQEALDVNVLFKNVSDDIAFQLVVKLFTKVHEEIRDLEDYFDYIWSEHGNGARWEFAVEKHNDSQAQLSDLEIILGDLLATQAKDWKGIPQLIGDIKIDIKYVLYEMPSDLGIDFINNYLGHIDDMLHHFELEKESKQGDIERKRATEGLEELQDKLIAIRDDEVNSEKEWEREREKLEEAVNREHQELIDWLNNIESERQVTESKEAVMSTATS